MRNKISSEHHEIGIERLGQADCPFDPRSSHIRAKMEVADLCDAETLKLLRQPLQVNCDSLRYQVFRFYKEAVNPPNYCHRGSAD